MKTLSMIALIACLPIACTVTADLSEPPPDLDPTPVELPENQPAAILPADPTPTTIAMVTSTGPLIAWDYGLLQVGGASPALVLTVVNNTAAVSDVLQVSFSGSDASQFTLAAGTDCVNVGQIRLAPGASCSIRPRFSPTTSGAKATSLTINGGAAGSASILLSGTGAPVAVLTTQPAAFAFAVTEFGHPATKTFTLTNVGVAVAIQSIAIGGTSSAAFAVASTTCTGALAASASCSIDVRFDPQTFGEGNGNLTVMTDHGSYGVGNWVNGWGGARLTVQMTGHGIVYSDGGGYPDLYCGPVNVDEGPAPTCTGLFISAAHAVAASGNLLSWGGACTGSAASCLLTLSTAETVVTASFAP